MARITVSRRARDDVKDRQVVVSLDGAPFATLMYGDALTREVAPGLYRLRAHNTLFWKAVELDLQPGEHARFPAVNRAGPGTYSFLGLLGVGPLYLTFRREVG